MVPENRSPAAHLDWRSLVHHRLWLRDNITVEEAYHALLEHKAEFAAVVDNHDRVIAVVSLKRVSAVLSLKYGQPVYSRRPMAQTLVCVRPLGSEAGPRDRDYAPLITPLDHVMALRPGDDFFRAQEFFQNRDAEHQFDDILLYNAREGFEGLIRARDFIELQSRMVAWQQDELGRQNRRLLETLQQLSEAQDELVNKAKMAALGEMVAGLAHELNTPLGVLLGSHENVALALEKEASAGSAADREKCEKMIRSSVQLGKAAAERVSGILRSLRIFCRRDQEMAHDLDIAEVLDSSLLLLGEKFKSGVRIQRDYQGNFRMKGYPGQLSQVFLNLGINAWQAMEGRGDLTVVLRENAEGFRIVFQDSGPGIPEKFLSRIFDPGFTTKGVGVGTGLGLSICKKIVEAEHGGVMSAENRAQGGAVFTILLPAAPRVSVGESLLPALELEEERAA